MFALKDVFTMGFVALIELDSEITERFEGIQKNYQYGMLTYWDVEGIVDGIIRDWETRLDEPMQSRLYTYSVEVIRCITQKILRGEYGIRM